MAETHFFMSEEDSLAFVAFLIEAFCAEFVPHKSKSPPPFPRYSSVDEVEGRIGKDEYFSRFLVLSPNWERYPLGISEIHANDGSHFFSVRQRYGGPGFDFILSRICTVGSAAYRVPGGFSDYPYYIREFFLTDTSRYETFDRPQGMIDAYRTVQSYLRRTGCRSVAQETGRTGPWMLPGAMKECRRGRWQRIVDWHCVPKEKKSKPTSSSSRRRRRRG